jgi:hypothetical protein
VGIVREQRPLIRLLEALEAEQIRYIVIGAAAIAQGVTANTLDMDLWIWTSGSAVHVRPQSGVQTGRYRRPPHRSLPGRRYARELRVRSHGTRQLLARALACDARRIHGHKLPVLRLERILKSKASIAATKTSYTSCSFATSCAAAAK